MWEPVWARVQESRYLEHLKEALRKKVWFKILERFQSEYITIARSFLLPRKKVA